MFENFIWDNENDGLGGDLVIWGKNTKVVIISDEEPCDKKLLLLYQTDIEKKLNFLEENKTAIAKSITKEIFSQQIKKICELMYIKVCFIEVSARETEIYMTVKIADSDIAEEFGVTVDTNNKIECEGLV